jgi:hypothetical protein
LTVGPNKAGSPEAAEDEQAAVLLHPDLAQRNWQFLETAAVETGRLSGARHGTRAGVYYQPRSVLFMWIAPRSLMGGDIGAPRKDFSRRLTVGQMHTPCDDSRIRRDLLGTDQQPVSTVTLTPVNPETSCLP